VPKSASDALFDQRTAFQTALLRWFREHQRRLPWREKPSLYKTVVSEFMLQQTQVKTVLPYFARWLETLPTFAALAAAPESTVMKLWEGLGYYSRARNLQRLAKAVVARPEPPTSLADWLELPGVGPYTAAAITSIALNFPAACVDGNVVRILARLTADATSFRDSATAAKAFRPLAEKLLSQENPGDHNQAMMELGATICHRQNPLCTVCPVYAFCAGAKSGEPEKFPQLALKKIEAVAVTRVWWLREGHLLLHRAAPGAKRLADLHELPRASDSGFDEAALAGGAAPLAIKRRAITRYAITETIHDVSEIPRHAGKARPAFAEDSGLVWIPLNELESITLSGPHRRWITEFLKSRLKDEGVREGNGQSAR
jgi:A/G-specific adenine glycosylase